MTLSPASSQASSLEITDGTHTVTAAAELDFTAGATVTASGTTAQVAVAGGITQSYIGTTSIGGTTDAQGAGVYKQVYKTVTPAATCVLSSIDVYVEGNATNAGAIYAALVSDNAGAPGLLIGTHTSAPAGASSNITGIIAATGRWVSLPLGALLTGGTPYWLAVIVGNGVTLYYAAAGSDYTSTISQTYLQVDTTAPSTSTRNYSIRGNVFH